MILTQSEQYTAGRRAIGLNLLWQVFFVDRTDGQDITDKSLHASFPTNALVIEKIGKVVRTDEQIKLAI